MTVLERQENVRTVTWSGSTTSSAVKIEPSSVASLYVPATFAGTQVTFQAEDNGAYSDVYFEGAIVTVPITADTRTILPAETMAINGLVKIVSDASETLEGTLHIVR